ncbi:MAG: YciK family oxidoreductase [Pseudomonadota bacterium]
MSTKVIQVPSSYIPAADALDGKTILVTGASNGIGKRAAISYAEHGATIALLSRSVEGLEKTYDEIIANSSREPLALPFDLARVDEDAYRELASLLASQCPQLDGLLLNAGTLGDRKPLSQYSWSQWQEVMQVNVSTNFLLLRELLPLLDAAPSASVVLTSSGVGRSGRAYWGAYAVSKFAVEGLSQVMASELENTSKIRCNCINPGAVNTAMRRAAYPAEPPSSNPDPEAILRSYLYLMDDVSMDQTGLSFDAQ